MEAFQPFASPKAITSLLPLLDDNSEPKPKRQKHQKGSGCSKQPKKSIKREKQESAIVQSGDGAKKEKPRVKSINTKKNALSTSYALRNSELFKKK